MGETAAKAAFLALGWGAATAPEFDVGTDLFLLVRDTRMFDLGMLVGAQVKTGDSFFAEPDLNEDGEPTGWWFRDSTRKHVDYWLSHTLPHLIVLHDHHLGISYWAHIITESVVSTGRGAKVFVPRTNTVDVDHRAELLAVAATRRPPSVWEGSAWTGDTTLAPSDVLRHAMIVPRLVAPHRNAGTSTPVSAEQGLALIVDARVEDYERFADQHAQVPSLSEAPGSLDWRWRFAGAMGTRVTTGEVAPVLVLVSQAPTPAARAAASVAAAAVLLEQAHPQQACALLDDALANDDDTPVDHAWLTLQRARALLELGRADDARAAALAAQHVRVTHADDVTATAIAGTAALLLFSAAEWGEKDVQDAITGSDTTAAWWRYQTVAAGAGAVIDREFDTWSRRSSLRLHGEDVPNNRLYTAALLASHLGDHGAWRSVQTSNVQQTLLRMDRASDTQHVRDLLAALRTSGDDRAVGLAVRHLVDDGPADAVTAAAADIDLASSTRTTRESDLVFLDRGGDVVDAATAHAAVTWLLAALRPAPDTAPADLPRRGSNQLLTTLASVTPAAPPADHDAVADAVLALPPCADQALATWWAGVVMALSRSTWVPQRAVLAIASAPGHADPLRWALLSAASRAGHVDARNLLVDEARHGHVGAFVALGDPRLLPEDATTVLIGVVAAQVDKQVSEAARGMYALGMHSPGEELARLNVAHPAVSRWDPIFRLLQEPEVAASDKAGVCLVLAVMAPALGDDTRSRLAELALAIVDQPPAVPSAHDPRPGAVGPAALLAATLHRDEEVTQTLLSRLLHDDDHRQWAPRLALLLDPSHAAGVLAPLTTDPDPVVRGSAASCLARLIGENATASPLALTALRHCMADPGIQVPRAITRALATVDDPTPGARKILSELARHRSAAVRAMVDRHHGTMR